MSAAESLRAAMRQTGLDFASPIHADGELHRFRASGDRERNSWYVLHAGPPPAGAFGCWKRGFKEVWCEHNDSLSQAEWDGVRRGWQDAERERLRVETEQRDKARKTAAWILKRANPVRAHAYLSAKGVKAFGGMREYHGALVLPLRDINGELHSVQFIAADGLKKFLSGGRIAGCFFGLADKPDGPLVLCEGYATGASIHEATDLATVCAMNCGNLMAVAKALRQKFPSREIAAAADNDAWTNGNPGLTKARQAAFAIGAKLAVPQFEDVAMKPTDFNDLHQLQGLDTVKAQLEGATIPTDSNDSDNESPKAAKVSTATRLVQIADALDFFHDPQGRAFARLEVGDHVEVWPVSSSSFRSWLAEKFYRQTRSAANRNAVGDALLILESQARFGSPELPVFLRVAAHDGGILIDLCDRDWRAVKVTVNGWEILDRSPVPFIRTGAMRPLPLPVPSSQGTLNPLWELLNVTPAQRSLVAGALLVCFHPSGPFFVLNFLGEQGTAKSCAARIVRLLVDPNETPLRSPPRDERDLLVQAASNWCVALDNLSTLPPWLSDGLCRLSTGGGHSARSLYTDAEEFTLSVKRPVILNGIEDVATRPDLAERALQIELETIPDDRRMPERELWHRFEAARPGIFSAILNALACALRELPNLRFDALPRMADAALWATAGETAFGWETGTFTAAYWVNLNEGAIASLDAHPVGVALRQLLDGVPKWTGEAAQLLRVLNDSASEELRHSQNWPKTARTLSTCLRRLAQALRRAGFGLEFGRGKRRTVQLCRRADFASPASPMTDIQPPADANDAKLRLLHGEKPLVEELA